MSSFNALGLKRVMTHVGVGMGAASFWRGAWYVLDDHLYPDDAASSALASFGMGVIGMAASQGLVARVEHLSSNRLPYKAARFGALYTIAVSCVLVWRGTWVGWDVLYEKYHSEEANSLTSSSHSDNHHHHHHFQHAVNDNSDASTDSKSKPVEATDPGHATKSGVLSHIVAVSILAGTGMFASVLAPPAATSVIRDFAVRATGKRNPFVTLWRPPSTGVGRATTSSSSSKTKIRPTATPSLLARNYNHMSRANKVMDNSKASSQRTFSTYTMVPSKL